LNSFFFDKTTNHDKLVRFLSIEVPCQFFEKLSEKSKRPHFCLVWETLSGTGYYQNVVPKGL
jgi:hypothetical protein